ncbi:hypothetical protein [Desulfogranum marinum]|uniref:hypothetical protein n=1 Tax=Desulfogranum marinum TaxID=453220 RepID=UPI0029C8E433|nr:hypothetical protein [Desulfogranum marinum]
MQSSMVASIMAIVFFAFCLNEAQAHPTERFDQRTQMCRLIAKPPLDWESEPWGTGGKKFREVCKSCHSRESDSGAPFLHAESYTSAAWNRIFFKRRKKCARDGSWDVLTQEELLLVNDYLYRNGAWTYDPNDADSCG